MVSAEMTNCLLVRKQKFLTEIETRHLRPSKFRSSAPLVKKLIPYRIFYVRIFGTRQKKLFYFVTKSLADGEIFIFKKCVCLRETERERRREKEISLPRETV